MINEAVLKALLAQVADEIPVPAAGPEHVVSALAVSSNQRRRTRPHLAKPLMAAAAAVVVILLAVPMLHNESSSKRASQLTAGGETPALLEPNRRARHGPGTPGPR